MSHKHESVDQYQDNANPSHNVGQAEVEQCSGILIRRGVNEPLFAYPQFDDAGNWTPAYPVNPDPPPAIGTSNLQDFTRLLSFGHGGDPHGRQGKPTACIVSTDNGQTWQFVSDVIIADTEDSK